MVETAFVTELPKTIEDDSRSYNYPVVADDAGSESISSFILPPSSLGRYLLDQCEYVCGAFPAVGAMATLMIAVSPESKAACSALAN